MNRRIVSVETWHQGIPDADEQTRLDAEQLFFRDSGLLDCWRDSSSDFVLAETDFSIGLNTLLACYHWLKTHKPGSRLHYFSCVSKAWQHDDLARLFARWPTLAAVADDFLAVYPVLTPGFHRLLLAEGRICINLMMGNPLDSLAELLCCADAELEPMLRARGVDAWFATAENTPELVQRMRLLSGPETRFTGLNSLDSTPVKTTLKRFTPWAFPKARPVSRKRALVLGAGLAGCFSAHALAERGWEVVLIDSASRLAAGASGNPQTVLYPMLSAWHSPLADFMLTAYLYAHQWYRRVLCNQSLGELRGILQLAQSPKEKKAQLALRELLTTCPALGEQLNAEQASVLAGLPVPCDALYLPLSGWMDTPALCAWLVAKKGIRVELNQTAETLVYEQGQWHAGSHQAEVLVLANGYEARRFELTAHLPLIPVAGQLTQIACSDRSTALAVPLCAKGHVLPQRHARHYLGATYHRNTIAREAAADDDRVNMDNLKHMLSDSLWSDKPEGNWYGTRGATPDYLPFVGPAPIVDYFQQRFAPLATDRKRWIAAAGEYYPGLYVCAGFGSRGLTSIPLCADWLAAQINQEMNFLPRSLVQAISPARFVVKGIIEKGKA
ncbi:FAD-dependent 5-carboxymethylaminomethyl-2-thiouridine(34) oxidoreductase MnmC [Legionella sp. CNM-4043-24]|uniref:FAD-dependent 5-carboxymethylaminomethyl-2-thiouridine(34) oxidoreductase MnmC n=1 Tax=Legionella sp. CNM-4043-24 TaxID=3421646 RepID=UPI00403A9BE9